MTLNGDVDSNSERVDLAGPARLEAEPDVLVKGLLQSAICSGEIDIIGVGDAEIERQMEEYLDEFRTSRASNTVTLEVVLDHGPPILDQARKFAKEEQLEFACLFYATWIEHWANETVCTLAARHGLPQDSSALIVRKTNLQAKLTWVLDLLGVPQIDQTSLKAITSVSEARNSYVHYKFKPVSNMDEYQESLRTAIVAAEEAISALERYADQNGLGKSIDQIVERFIERRSRPTLWGRPSCGP